MKIFKMALAVICALAVTATMTSSIFIGGVPVSAEAANELMNSAVELADEEKPMSGKCGDNLTWVLDAEGTLTISGTGEMYSHLQWHYRDDINAVLIEDGVTSISGGGTSVNPAGAFSGCSNLRTIKIPDSVTTIGEFAFAECNNLTSISIPNSVTEIGRCAFADCENLLSVIISNGLDISIEVAAFVHCTNLKSIYFPQSVRYIGENCFTECTSLSDVYYEGTADQWYELTYWYTDGGTGNNKSNRYLSRATVHYNSAGTNDTGEPSGEKVTFNGHTYQVFKFDNVTGRDVISYCKKMGGYMAHINDAEENAFLSNYIRESNIGYAYFGYTDEEVEGDWKWVDGKNSSYTNWGKNEPNNEHGEEHYAIINQDGSWNDGGFEGDSAKGRAFVICEWEDEESTEQTAGSVHFLSSYNPETDKVGLDNSLEYTFSDTIDQTVIPSMLNKYVLTEVDTSTFTVTSLKPVESKIATILDVDGRNISLGENVFLPVSQNIIFMPTVGTKAIWHIYNNEVVSFDLLSEKSGLFNRYDKASGQVTINNQTYSTNFLTDMSFVDELDKLTQNEVTFWASEETYPIALSVSFKRDSDYKYKVYLRGDEFEWFSKSIDDLIAETPSTTYSPALSHMLIAVSNSAYDQFNIERTLKNLKFSRYQSYNYDKYPNDCGGDPVAFSFGQKTISNGKKLVLIAVRGSTSFNLGNQDWWSNFNLGNPSFPGLHAGFAFAADEVTKSLGDFLDNDFSNTIFVITGHSRGGGIGNLVAFNLDSKGISKENVYGYNFACPDTAKSTSQVFNSYNNIFNIGNSPDPVSVIPGLLGDAVTEPGVVWGKFGQSRWFATEWDNYDNLKLDWSFYAHHQYDFYYNYLKGGPSFSAFKTWEERTAIIAGNTIINTIPKFVGKLIGISCPVDVIISDENGNRLASVIGDEIEYYDSTFGEVIILKDGDKKVIYVEGDRPLYVHLTATDEGTMEYTVKTVDYNQGKIFSEKTFENVALVTGKEMLSMTDVEEITGIGDDVSKVPLYVLDEENKPIKEVIPDGNGTEVPISSENTYKITFDANGGTSSDTELNTNTSGMLSILPTATREGYTFEGWFTAAENGEKITTETKFIADTIVYAHWTKNTGNSESPSVPDTSDNPIDEPSSGLDSNGSSGDSSLDSDVNADSGSLTDSSTNDTSNSMPNGSASGADSNDSDSNNPSTGVTVAIIPILFAAGASVVIFHKKNRK